MAEQHGLGFAPLASSDRVRGVVLNCVDCDEEFSVVRPQDLEQALDDVGRQLDEHRQKAHPSR